MVARRWWWLALAIVALVGGCGQVEEDAPPPAPPEDPPERLGSSIDVSLSDLLSKPRSDLAALADEWAARAQVQEQARRDRRVLFEFLPDARFPLVVPVLREAHFSPEAGLSLPPYIAEGTKDSEFALHLARYGDQEAARQVVDPADAETRRRIDACRYERNYPVEWTRLVGLMLHVAQMRLAGGEIEGATELILLHRQLRDVLDARAGQGPLGAVLLPPGRQVLGQAVRAWKAARRTTLLAEDVENALADWGDVPAATLPLKPGAARADVARLLRSPGQGHVIPALATQRGLDLLDLPLPPEGVQAVVAVFDAADRLGELLVIYRPGVATLYPGPRDLAYLLEQRGRTGEDRKAPGLLIRTYPLGDFTCEALVVSRGNPVGALARFAAGRSGAATLPRDFGAVHLDRGFEQNRVRLAPEHAGTRVGTERPALLKEAGSLLRGVAPARVAVERAGPTDATARVSFNYVGNGGTVPLHETALRLWAEGGPAQITGQEDENGGHLILVWNDARTRITLRMPYADGQTVDLDAEDVSGTDPARRAVEAAAFDRQERQARLKAGTALTRLPRHLNFEGVQLGSTRAQVLQALPRGESVAKQTVPGGLMVTFIGEPAKGAPHVARQSFIRFDDKDRAVELRTRYGGGTTGSNWSQALLNGLKRRCGAPAERPGTWTALWADLPPRKPAATLYRWQDDLAILTCQRDAWGLEVTLRDAAGSDPDGVVALPVLEFLPRGPGGEVALGTAREALLRTAGEKPGTLADGALVLTPRGAGPYDTLMVWLDGDRVTRVVARYAQAAPPRARPAQLAQLLTEAWGRDGRGLGWPMRQDVVEGQAVQGLGWHDERTRVRLFWQESENGPPRLYGEWKEVRQP